MTIEFMPAAWLDAKGYEIDDLTIVLDHMADELANDAAIALMLACADDAAYYRAVGVYQMFPLNVVVRVRMLLGDSGQHADALLNTIRNIRKYLSKANSGGRRASKTATRLKHAAVAAEYAKGSCGACLMLVHQLPEKQAPQARTQMQRMAVRLREGHQNIIKFKTVLEVRARYGIDARAVAMSEEEIESHNVGRLAQSLHDLGVQPEDVEGLLLPGPHDQSELGDPVG